MQVDGFAHASPAVDLTREAVERFGAAILAERDTSTLPTMLGDAAINRPASNGTTASVVTTSVRLGCDSP